MAQTQYAVSGSGAGTDVITCTYQTDAAAALPTRTIFTAPFACVVSVVKAIFDVTAGATSTIGIYKASSTTAAGTGGTLILTAAMDFAGTARTVLTPALSATAADYTLAAGDRLSVAVASGSATGDTAVNITVALIKS